MRRAYTGDDDHRASPTSRVSGRCGYVTNVTANGFGFIKVRGQSLDLFFLQMDLQDGLEFGPQLLERFVRFDVATQQDGRPKATNIRPGD